MMNEERRGRLVLLVSAVMTGMVAFAFQPIPKESAKALGVTRGKAFSSGAVFVNGKYVEPPYVVERWGTGIRINAIPVTGQVIDWTEFVKTQPDVKVEKTEPAVPAAPAPVAAPVSVDVDESSLDDLFDDDPKPAKKAARTGWRPTSVRPAAQPSVSYSLAGEFVPNEATKRMLARINATRTDIDRIVRAGGFICFGDTYSQVSGDARTLREMLTVLPDLMQHAGSAQDFSAKVRAARLVYLHEILREDLYRNRVDYRKLKALSLKIEKENELNDVLNSVAKPLF